MKEGWKREFLKNACRVFTDGNWIQSKDQSSGGIRLVQTGNVGFGYFKNKEDKSRFISEETFERLKCTEILPGDLLVSRLPDPVGKSCIIPDLNIKMITGVDCTIIRPKDYLLSDYLGYFQMSNEYLKDVQSRVSGTTRSRISRKKLGLIEIPIPPLQEQKQIVALLDKAFTAIDQAKANIEKNIANAKELFQSKLNDIFSQKGAGWEEKTLGEVCNLVGGGTPSKKVEEYYNGEIPWATVRDMNSDKLEFTDHQITELGLKKSSSNIIPKNHIIIATRVGLGKVCILQQNTAINQDLKGIIPKAKFEILNEFIFWWYKSIAHQVINAGTGATVQGVKLTFVNQLTFPLGKIEEQERIVSLLNQFSSDIEKLENSYSSKLKDLEELKKSILQKAFAGELTNQSAVGSN